MVSPQTSLFHNYTTVSCGGYGGPVADHCLQSDLRSLYPSSPNSLTMYEQDHIDSARSLTSSSSDSLGDIAPLEDLDCNSESLKLDLDSLCPSFVEESCIRGDAVWSPTESSHLKMEDIFRVDKNEMVQGPTLAQLNSEDSITLLDDIALLLGNDLESQKGYLWGQQTQPVSTPVGMHQRTCTITSSNMMPRPQQPSLPPPIKQEVPFQVSATFSVYSSSPSVPATPVACSPLSSTPQKKQLLQEYLSTPSYVTPLGANRSNMKVEATTPMPPVKQEPLDYNMTVQSMDRKWEEIKQFIDEDKAAQASAAAAAAAAAAARVSPKIEPQDVAYSPSEDMDTTAVKTEDEEDTEAPSDAETEEYDHAEFLLSEAESEVEDSTQTRKKQKRYFWQYNTQAKGPKGKRLCKSVTNGDPHVLNDFEDPVFDPDLNQMSYKHNGKARKGDGNDITPNPLKLFQIGQELKKLTRIINDLRPVNELPVSVRSRSRKEKNKLASRACRLKKKAQHEANKLKLYGLDNEHKGLMTVLNSIKKNYVNTIDDNKINNGGRSYLELYNNTIQLHLAGKVAGHTARYVNTVLAKVSGGDPTGGINV